MWPTLIRIGSYRIGTFGAIVAIAIFLSMELLKKLAKKESLDLQVIDRYCFLLVFWSVVGARIFYTFIENWDYFSHHPLEFFSIHSGGISMFGSIIGGGLTAYIFSIRNRINVWRLLDISAAPLALGIGIGKLGCFAAGCCYGKVCNLPWAVTFRNPESFAQPLNTPLHPTQLYETFSWVILSFVLYKLFPKRKNQGENFFMFCMIFGVVRFFIEFLRGEPTMFASLSIHQVAAAFTALFGVIFFIKVRLNK